jgi:hypothetical protein
MPPAAPIENENFVSSIAIAQDDIDWLFLKLTAKKAHGPWPMAIYIYSLPCIFLYHCNGARKI